MLPGRDDTTSVFVVPKDLEINVGDVLSSAQAGGLMHKVNWTTDTGKGSFFPFRPYVIIKITLFLTLNHRVAAES